LQKHTGGFVRPSDRDLAINRAQYELFAERLGLPQGYGKDNSPPPVAYDRNRRISDSLLPFKKETVINISNGVGTFPSDYQYLDAFRVRYFVNPATCPPENDGVLRYASVDILQEMEWADRTSSPIDFPTYEYPILRFKSATTVEISPRLIPRVEMIYLAKPLPFYWGRTLVNGRYVFDPTDPANQPLQWYEVDQNQVLIRVLSYYGISIREGDLMQYAELKMKEGI